ncbi:MAG: nicotinate phosphoribosyltransferase [Candidatus Omnitrophica bacterium]|nr:nicotinate phosphoribosyltransferase [Candidatus Omnitrophota bacterium]HOX54115.1 nicotinate phosphoribosyltransferase [Candidatus Omnitrophota bacterium]
MEQDTNNKINLSMLLDLYEISMSASYFQFKNNAKAVFDLFIRRMPANRSFFMAAGLEDILDYLSNFSFDPASIESLRNMGIFQESFLGYLSKLRFSGDVWALREGEIFFPNEPVIRVIAPIIEAQLVESYLLNTVNLNTTIATKASRVTMAAKDRGVYDFSLRRTHGVDASLKAARASYIAGCKGTSNVLAGMKYKIPVAGTMAHSFVMSFDNELDSFRAFVSTFPKHSILLVDTYDNFSGVKNAIVVAKEMEKAGCKLNGIRLDSGDLAKLSKKVRIMLDKAGLSYVKIFASGNLDEYKIAKLLKKRAPIDNFGVGTNMGVSEDAPYCDVIYKISEVTDASGEFLPTMKLSIGKSTYPGRKQIYRILDNKGMFARDILALESESIKGMPLLAKVMESGKSIYMAPLLDEVRRVAQDNLLRLPDKYKRLNKSYRYPVAISQGLKIHTKKVLKSIKHRSRQ